jgi:hypothetical protein
MPPTVTRLSIYLHPLTGNFVYMKYVIIEDNKLKHVKQGIYEMWLEKNGERFVLPPVITIADNRKHIIDTDFVGIIEKNKETLPFVLFHFEDEITRKGELRHIAENVEYFETFEALKKRRNDLLKNISKN